MRFAGYSNSIRNDNMECKNVYIEKLNKLNFSIYHDGNALRRTRKILPKKCLLVISDKDTSVSCNLFFSRIFA